MKDVSKKNEFANEREIVSPRVTISPEIVAGLKKGDHRAFETLFHIFYTRVKSFIRMLTKDDDLAEELAQQVFVNLWINRERVNPDKNLSTYIYTMAKNSAIDAIKEQNRKETGDIDYVEEQDSLMTDDELIAKETELLVKLTVASMPPKRRQVYEMSRYEEKSNEEIAQELNISRKVVEKQLRLAIKKLREVISILLFIFFR